MDIFETTIGGSWVNSTLIALIQIMANVNKAGSFESWTKLTRLCIAWYQAGKPVVCNADAWDNLAFAEVL